MQIAEIPAQRQFVSAGCPAHSNAQNQPSRGAHNYQACGAHNFRPSLLREYANLLLRPQDVQTFGSHKCHAHSKAQLRL